MHMFAQIVAHLLFAIRKLRFWLVDIHVLILFISFSFEYRWKKARVSQLKFALFSFVA